MMLTRDCFLRIRAFSDEISGWKRDSWHGGGAKGEKQRRFYGERERFLAGGALALDVGYGSGCF